MVETAKEGEIEEEEDFDVALPSISKWRQWRVTKERIETALEMVDEIYGGEKDDDEDERLFENNLRFGKIIGVESILTRR